MPLLIDGHNLVGKIPGISLADPDDEVAPVRRLQQKEINPDDEVAPVRRLQQKEIKKDHNQRKGAT